MLRRSIILFLFMILALFQSVPPAGAALPDGLQDVYAIFTTGIPPLIQNSPYDSYGRDGGSYASWSSPDFVLTYDGGPIGNDPSPPGIINETPDYPPIGAFITYSNNATVFEDTRKHWFKVSANNTTVLSFQLSQIVVQGASFDVHDYGTYNIIGTKVGGGTVETGNISFDLSSNNPPLTINLASTSFNGQQITSFEIDFTMSGSNPRPADFTFQSFTISNAQAPTPPPTMTGISPTSGPTTGGTAVTITGTNFTGATAVKFGSVNAASFTVNSSTQITATSPAGSAGTVHVTVTTPGGTSATGSADQFTYLAIPTVSGISPASGPATGGTAVTITGTNFTGATAVKFGSVNAASFTVNSSTQITAVSPAGSAGTVHVTVTAADGTSAAGSSDQFTYVGPPTVTGLDGDSAAYTEGGSAVQLDTGGNAAAAEAVSWTGGKLVALISSGQDFAADLLGIANQGTGAGQIGLSGSYVTYGGTTIGAVGGGQGVLPLTVTFNSAATDEAVTALLRAVTFRTINNTAPSTTNRNIRVTLSNSSGYTSSDSNVTVSVTAVNTAPTFNSASGSVTSGAANIYESATAVATQPDGKILVAGNSAEIIDAASYTYGENKLLLARFNADGSLDSGFGAGGYATVNVWTSDSAYETGTGIAVLPDGKILVGAGSASKQHDNNPGFGLARFNADGSVDTNFGTNGVKLIAVGSAANSDTEHGMAVDAGGNILLVGESQWSGGSTTQLTTVVRIKPDGTLDTGFGTGGIVTTQVGDSYSSADGIAVQGDGKIVVAGTSYSGSTTLVSVIRYTTAGAPDTTFGTGGIATFDVASSYDSGLAVGIQPDGRIVVGGYGGNGTNQDFVAIRLNSNGTLDTGFNGTGKQQVDLGGDDYVYNLSVQSDGKIVLGGQSSFKAAFARLTSSGSLDTTFNGTGKLVIAGNSSGVATVLQGDNRILSVGQITDGSGAYSDLTLGRFNADGCADASFGTAANSLDATPSYTQGDPAVVLDNNVAVFDAELSGASFSGATLTLARNGGANSNDQFSASGTLGALTEGENLTVGGTNIGSVTTNSGGTLILTFSANATQSLVNSAMRQIAYSNSIASPSSAQINWTFSDGNSGGQGTGGAQSATGSTTVTVIRLNSAPALAANIGLSLNQTAGQTLITNTMLKVTDAEQTAAELTYTVCTPPSKGVLKNGGTNLAASGTFTQDDIDNGHITYTPAGTANGPDGFTFTVSDGAGGNIGSTTFAINIVDNVAPTVTDGNISISGATGTGGAFRIGDIVTAAWNNTAIGDNNSDVAGVTFDFSQFGGGTAVAATNSGGTWTATYTIVAGVINAANRNVSVTATDTANNAATTADTSNATVNNTAPSVTDGNLNISGATGTGGAFKIGDTVTAAWNNTSSGDNNNDVAGVTVDFSQFGGGAAVAATNSGGTWTATHTIVAGAINAVNRNVSVTVTDTALNITTTSDTGNAAVDNVAPTVTSVTVPANATYTTGQNLDFTVNWSENITVAGTDSTLGLTVGSNSRAAVYQSKTATGITYRYTVQSGDLDSDGVSVGLLVLNSGTIRDGVGNDAVLTINSVDPTSGVLVDGLIPTATAATGITFTGFTANWDSVGGATGYRLDVATDNGFSNLVSGYGNLDAGSATSYPVTGLSVATTYYYRVRAYNASGTGGSSNIITVLPRHTITPSSGGHGTISPDAPQPVVHDGTTTFNLSPDTGYHIDTVEGSCGGTLSGNSFLTNPVSADCTVIVNFAIDSYTITGTSVGHGTISCNSPVTYGSTVTCTITPDPDYRLSSLDSNGSDISAGVSLNRVTIDNVTQALTVTATFSPATYGALAVTSGNSEIGAYSTAFASDGTQHLVYERGGALYYRSSSGTSGNWSAEESIAAGSAPAVALGSDGSPTVAYLSGGQILATSRSGGSWSASAATGVIGADSVELSVDGSGVRHMVYTAAGADGYDDILYTSNASGSFAPPVTICDGSYADGKWTLCRTPLIRTGADGSYHIVYNKQVIYNAVGEHDPQWMVYTTNAGGGLTSFSHDLNAGTGMGSAQPVERGAFGYDPTLGRYSLVYGNDMESGGLWLAEDLDGAGNNGTWSETTVAVPGNGPVQGQDSVDSTRRVVYLTPDGRMSHIFRTGGVLSSITELAPSGAAPTVNPAKRSVLYRAADASGVQQLYHVGIDSLALLTPADGNMGSVIVGRTTEMQFTISNNGSKSLSVTGVGVDNSGNYFEIGTDGCTGANLVPGASCVITVKNIQEDFAGGITGTLTVTSDDPVRGTIKLPLTAQVVEPYYPLEIIVDGSGTVTATASGLSDFTCAGGVCSRNYDTGSVVNLSAQAPAGYTFSGFTYTGGLTGCCRDAGCSVTIKGDTHVTATFVRNTYAVTAIQGANGSLSCSGTVGYGDSVTCTVTPDTGYRIEGVGGSCGGTLNGNTYTTLPVTASCTVEAVFATSTQRTVSVSVTGSGSGTVYSDPAGIVCPLGDCNARFDDATAATLTAVPDSNSIFSGWSGACTNATGACEITLTTDLSVTAAFSASPKIKLGETGYDTFTQAYVAAPDGAVIRARSIMFTESPVFNVNRRITLEGGYNAPYDCNSCGDNTSIQGSITVGKGQVIIENLTIK